MVRWRSVVVDLCFWIPTLGAIYALVTSWGTLSTTDKIGAIWFGGYAPLIGGEMALQASGKWLDNWTDFTHGMMLVMGWIFGPLMWLYGFLSYVEAKENVGDWLGKYSESIGNAFAIIVVAGSTGAFSYVFFKPFGSIARVITGVVTTFYIVLFVYLYKNYTGLTEVTGRGD